jgi:hypothetical protein
MAELDYEARLRSEAAALSQGGLPVVKRDWTFEKAVAVHEAALAAGVVPNLRSAPLSLWVELKVFKMRIAFEKGDHVALMEAIARCMMYGVPIPNWAASAFCAGYQAIGRLEANSWDDVFGKPHAKGKHLKHKALRLKKREQVYHRIRELHAEGRAIDDELFERVGKELGVGGRTTCKGIYGEVRDAINNQLKSWSELDPPQKP